MNNTGVIFKTGIFITVINQVALSLGISQAVFDTVSAPSVADELTIGEALTLGYRIVINNASSFFQIISFQVDVPALVNLIVFTPLALAIFYLFISLVRGSS